MVTSEAVDVDMQVSCRNKMRKIETLVSGHDKMLFSGHDKVTVDVAHHGPRRDAELAPRQRSCGRGCGRSVHWLERRSARFPNMPRADP